MLPEERITGLEDKFIDRSVTRQVRLYLVVSTIRKVLKVPCATTLIGCVPSMRVRRNPL